MNPDLAEQVVCGNRIGQPAAVLRKRNLDLAARAAVVNQLDVALVNGDGEQVQVVVSKRDGLAICRPRLQGEIAYFPEQEGLGLFKSRLIAQNQLVLHTRIRDVGDTLAIRAPQPVLFADTRSLGQIAHGAILDRHGKHVTARADHNPFAGCRQFCRGHIAAGIFPLRPGLNGLRLDADGKLANAAA